MLGEPLTSPAPRGIGTDQCESLSSYVQRVAALHGSRPGQLVFRFFTWIDQGRSRNVGAWSHSRGRFLLGNNVNGFNQADSWVKALQAVTRRTDLSHLTTRGWDHLFPSRGFLAPVLAWCPLCLSTDAEPYHRLVWMLHPTCSCTVHRVSLQRCCARCRLPPPVLHDRSLVTACPRCGGDLRHIVEDRTSRTESEFESWVAAELGRIIARRAQWHAPMTWSPRHALTALARHQGIESPTAFAHAVGVSKVTAWYWLTGRARPSLPLALHAFHRCGASLAEQLGCPPVAADAVPTQPQFHLHSLRRVRDRNWTEIRAQLEAALNEPIGHARPLLAVARSIDIAVRTLRARFPSLCSALAERHRSCRTQTIKERDARLREQMEVSLAGLTQTTLLPTKAQVERQLNRPGLFNRRYARRIYHQLLSLRSSRVDRRTGKTSA